MLPFKRMFSDVAIVTLAWSIWGASRQDPLPGASDNPSAVATAAAKTPAPSSITYHSSRNMGRDARAFLQEYNSPDYLSCPVISCHLSRHDRQRPCWLLPRHTPQLSLALLLCASSRANQSEQTAAEFPDTAGDPKPPRGTAMPFLQGCGCWREKVHLQPYMEQLSFQIFVSM